MVLFQKKQYNILLLGQTGAGKSTFINGFCHHLSFKDLNEALKASQVPFVIPTIFEWYNEEKEQLHTVSVGLHEDKNERQEVGKSATQYVKSYLFEFGNVAIRIIDTPGFGDTGGDIDERICENLLKFLSNRREVQELHSIVFVFKSNENRMTIFFKYCLDQIFSKLHRDACENIAFVFTHSKGANYQPGTTFGLLKNVIKKMENVQIQCSKQNIFCIENDCIKFLLASFYASDTIKFDENAKEDYEAPWKRSCGEYMRLFMYVTSLKPHTVEDTVRINMIRFDCIKLRELLPKIVNEINENIQQCRDYEKEIAECGRDVASLKNVLYKISHVDKGKNRLLVCHNRRCRLRTETNKVICCSGCRAWRVSWCQQISFWKSSCHACGCNELEHAFEKEGVKIIKEKDTNIEENIESKEVTLNQSLLKLYEQKINRKKYEAEKTFIENYVIKLSRYLEKTTISSDQRMHENMRSTPNNPDTENDENGQMTFLPFVQALNPEIFEMMGEYIQQLFKQEDIQIPTEKIILIEPIPPWQEIAANCSLSSAST